MSRPSSAVAAAAQFGVQYVYGTIVTSEACASNNRGRNSGNNTTLQKAVYRGGEHTCVSAEAMRFAVRYWMQQNGIEVNRSYDPSTNRFVFKDEKYGYWGKPDFVPYADDDLLGFMNAEAPKEADADATLAAAETDAPEGVTEATTAAGEPGEESGGKTGKRGAKPKAKGKASKRTSPLAVSRALSLKPWVGENTFNCVGGVKEAGKLSLYGAEMHTTAYQFTFGLDTKSVVNKQNVARLVDALTDPCPVAGNHSRFYYEFAPESVIYRVTNAHSSRIQNIFDYDDNTNKPTAQRLIAQVECGDCPASEVIVGGEIARTEEGQQLARLGCKVFPSVFAASREVKRRVAANGGDFATVGEGTDKEDSPLAVTPADEGGQVKEERELVANPT
jgi:CRISPR-associated protein Cst2